VVKSSGAPELDSAALEYARTLKFGPARLNSAPANAAVPVVVIWSKEPVKLPLAGTQ
jgi:TonB family protein